MKKYYKKEEKKSILLFIVFCLATKIAHCTVGTVSCGINMNIGWNQHNISADVYI